MSTKSDRAWRANRHIIPIKIDVRQKDGSYITQILDADVRVRKAPRAVRRAAKAVDR